MKAARAITFSAALVFVLAVVAAWRCRPANVQARQALAALAERRGRALAEERKAEARIAAAKGAATELSKKLDPSGAEAVAVRKALKEAQKDAEGELRVLAVFRASVGASYGPFFRQLGLTPTPAGKFLDNLARRTELNRDLSAVLRSEYSSNPSISPGTLLAIDELRQQAVEEYQASQQELLGSAGYAQLLAYDRVLPAQTIASALAGSAVLAGAPFSRQQTEQLTQVLAKAGGAASDDSGTPSGAIDWDAVDAQAQSILSPAQFAAFKSVELPGTNGRYWNQFRQAYTDALQADASRGLVPAPGL